MIRLKQIIANRSPVLDSMKRQGVLEGIEKGREEFDAYLHDTSIKKRKHYHKGQIATLLMN